MEFNYNILAEANKQYTTRLVKVLLTSIYTSINDIYEEAEGDIRSFQDGLRHIVNWDNDRIEEEIELIVETSKFDRLEKLVLAVFKINTQILTVIRTTNGNSEPKKIDLVVPSLNRFIHRVYVEVAREYYKNPYLFDLQGKNARERQDTLRDSLHLISDSIKSTITAMLPYEGILDNYLDEVDQETEVEQTGTGTELDGEESSSSYVSDSSSSSSSSHKSIHHDLTGLVSTETETDSTTINNIPDVEEDFTFYNTQYDDFVLSEDDEAPEKSDQDDEAPEKSDQDDEPVPEPESVPETEPVPEPVPDPEPVPETELETEFIPETETEIEPVPGTEIEPETVPETEPVPQNEPVFETEPVPETETEIEPVEMVIELGDSGAIEFESELELEPEPEPEVEVEPVLKKKRSMIIKRKKRKSKKTNVLDGRFNFFDNIPSGDSSY